MIIVLKPEATKAQADEILERIGALGLKPLYMPGTERVVLGALGDERVLEGLRLESHPMVESVQRILAPYKLVGSAGTSVVIMVTLDGMLSCRRSIIDLYGSCSRWPCDTIMLLAAMTRPTPARLHASKTL